jgi:hypothetical protein
MDASEPRDLASYLSPRLSLAPAALVFRIARSLQARAERLGLARARGVPLPEGGASPRPWIQPPPRAEAARYLAAAERIRLGELDIFALRGFNLGHPPRWNRDPKTGIQAPLLFGKTLDCRDPDQVGDIRYLWELNRHLHLVTLAQAHALSGERKYFDELAEQLDSWLVACPYGQGPNWAAASEAAIRLVNWSLAWQLVQTGFEGGRFAELRGRWLASVYQHAEFVRGWLSLHPSANRHLIAEAGGLFIAGLTWPHWRRASDWVGTAKRILEREALAQNAPDGVNRQRAMAHQRFVLDVLVLCLLAGRANGQPFSAEYEARVEAMLDFLAALMDAGGNVPMVGEADEGVLARLSQEPGFCPNRSLLATGALLFGRGDFKLKAGRLDDKTRAIVGADAEARYASLDARKRRLPPRRAFTEGGYYVLGCDFDSPQEIRLVTDALALAFTLSLGGREFLIDPGNYAHPTQRAWSAYFSGTSAHNTVRIDGKNQACARRGFLRRKHARAACTLWLSSGEKDCFEGWHDGYVRLADPVKHRRRITLDKAAARIVVEDTLEMAEDHGVELFFHCHEDSSVEPTEAGYVVRRGDAFVQVDLPRAADAKLQVYRGSLAPILGWVSRAFDVRAPAPTIAWSARLSGRTVLRTEIVAHLPEHR